MKVEKQSGGRSKTEKGRRGEQEKVKRWKKRGSLYGVECRELFMVTANQDGGMDERVCCSLQLESSER